jgi:hypothetical protein
VLLIEVIPPVTGRTFPIVMGLILTARSPSPGELLERIFFKNTLEFFFGRLLGNYLKETENFVAVS